MNQLTEILIDEQHAYRKGGLYHKTQVQLAYNSNHIEGCKLTEEKTRYIFDTRTIGFKDQEAASVDHSTFTLLIQHEVTCQQIPCQNKLFLH